MDTVSGGGLGAKPPPQFGTFLFLGGNLFRAYRRSQDLDHLTCQMEFSSTCSPEKGTKEGKGPLKEI